MSAHEMIMWALSGGFWRFAGSFILVYAPFALVCELLNRVIIALADASHEVKYPGERITFTDPDRAGRDIAALAIPCDGDRDA